MGNSRRFKRAMKGGRSRGRMVSGGYGGIKMSEVLLDFAEPLVGGFSLPEDRDAYAAALKLAGLLWNEAVSPNPGGKEVLYAKLSEATGEPRDSEMEKMFDAVIARGRMLYPHLDRLIKGVDVTIDDDGEGTVRVISAV